MTDLVNVLGEPLRQRGGQPLAGGYQDGFGRTDDSDLGQHSIWSVMTKEFLSYTLAQGNNLVDPNPMFDFYGLKPGDHWCLCLSRWEQARNDGLAPPVILESTHISSLRMIPLKILKCYDSRGS